MANDRRQREIYSVAEEAAHWLLVLKSPDAEQCESFRKWLNASPLHVRELLLATRIQRRLKSLDGKRRLDVQALIEEAGSTALRIDKRLEITPRRRAEFRWYAATAACLVALAITVLATLFWDTGRRFSTGVGQQLVFRLEDGSTITLNTNSQLKADFSSKTRGIYLERGQALFEVNRDPSRPFRVHTLNTIVEAIGTQFDVRVLDNRTMVAVIEGAVKVDKAQADAGDHVDARSARLVAGESINVDAVGEVRELKKIDVTAVSAWKQQQLVFNGATLEWIVSEFNRYNARPTLQLQGERIGDRRYHGVFNAHRPKALIEYLQRDPSLEFDQTDSTILIREASLPPLNPNLDIGNGTRAIMDRKGWTGAGDKR